MTARREDRPAQRAIRSPIYVTARHPGTALAPYRGSLADAGIRNDPGYSLRRFRAPAGEQVVPHLSLLQGSKHNPKLTL